MAKVLSFQNNFLTLKAQYKPKIGDSIAVNGACLTVVKITNESFSVELSPESQKILAMENYQGEVHIEPAMQMGDRFEGHIVQGHVDCLGVVRKKRRIAGSLSLEVAVPPGFRAQLIPKGSVAVDGVSLTIVEIRGNLFSVQIIPHTAANTTLGKKGPADKLNIEFDILAKKAAVGRVF